MFVRMSIGPPDKGPYRTACYRLTIDGNNDFA
jgi:hypothetical protein